MRRPVVSLLLNTREAGRRSHGDILEFIKSITTSVASTDNVEAIFKCDDDDELAAPVIERAKKEFPQVSIKYFHSPRVYYKGVHIGYTEALQWISNDSVALYPVADDTPFLGRTEWDASIISHCQACPDGISLVQMAPIGVFTDGVIFSKKLIDLIGFGPVYAIDQWGFSLSRMLVEMGEQHRIGCIEACGGRKGCELDFPTTEAGKERWYGDRQTCMDYLASEQYKILLEGVKRKIGAYLYP